MGGTGVPPVHRFFLLRWPNDVIEPPGPRERKIAGILIERRGHLILLGIGLNVSQAERDFPAHLRERAASLRMLGADADRVHAARCLTRRLVECLAEPPQSILADWQARDVLRGTEREFVCDGTRCRGVVESVSPLSEIVVRAPDGTLVRLPALTTSLAPPAA